MKQKDFALIIVIAAISAVISFIVSNKLFVTSGNRRQTAEVVDVINADFTAPDKKYFNSTSIDSTVTSQLGANSNQDPFNGSGQ